MTDKPSSSQTTSQLGESADANHVDSHQRRRCTLISVATLVLLGLSLYLPGIRWGLPATSSWSQDTIAAFRTLGAIEGWPDAWKGRYPPLHYLILASAYQPVIGQWDRTGQRVTDPTTGQAQLQPPHAPKIGLLILIARVLSAMMAIAAALGLRATVLRLGGSDLAAMISAVVLMMGAAFGYFARLGNVDIPSICWFCWSLYFYARALESKSWRDCALLGLFGALAISTKDAVAGMYPGMAIVLLVGEGRRVAGDRFRWGAVLSALWRVRWLVGLAAFILPYLFINGAFSNPEAYWTRMKYWLGITPGTLHAKQYRYPDQFSLFAATIRYWAAAVGWPMLCAMSAAALYVLFNRRRLAIAMLLPAMGYYLIVIIPTGFVYSRFLFPPIAVVCVCVGFTAADWIAGRRGPALRLVLPCAILLSSLGYTVALTAELITDTRYESERWFERNVVPPSSVGAFSKPQYTPRLRENGYATYAVTMARESFERPQPDYLVLTSYNYEDFDEKQQACFRDLLAGKLGYSMVETFKSTYLGAGASWLSLAGRGSPTPGKISPTIVILKRADSQGND